MVTQQKKTGLAVRVHGHRTEFTLFVNVLLMVCTLLCSKKGTGSRGKG